MTYTVVKRGHDDWKDLIGKEISFDWYDGYDDLPYWFQGILEYTVRSEDRYYVIMDGGGPAVREHEEVKVTVHE